MKRLPFFVGLVVGFTAGLYWSAIWLVAVMGDDAWEDFKRDLEDYDVMTPWQQVRFLWRSLKRA